MSGAAAVHRYHALLNNWQDQITKFDARIRKLKSEKLKEDLQEHIEFEIKQLKARRNIPKEKIKDALTSVVSGNISRRLYELNEEIEQSERKQEGLNKATATRLQKVINLFGKRDLPVMNLNGITINNIPDLHPLNEILEVHDNITKKKYGTKLQRKNGQMKLDIRRYDFMNSSYITGKELLMKQASAFSRMVYHIKQGHKVVNAPKGKYDVMKTWYVTYNAVGLYHVTESKEEQQQLHDQRQEQLIEDKIDPRRELENFSKRFQDGELRNRAEIKEMEVFIHGARGVDVKEDKIKVQPNLFDLLSYVGFLNFYKHLQYALFIERADGKKFVWEVDASHNSKTGYAGHGGSYRYEPYKSVINPPDYVDMIKYIKFHDRGRKKYSQKEVCKVVIRPMYRDEMFGMESKDISGELFYNGPYQRFMETIAVQADFESVYEWKRCGNCRCFLGGDDNVSCFMCTRSTAGDSNVKETAVRDAAKVWDNFEPGWICRNCKWVNSFDHEVCENCHLGFEKSKSDVVAEKYVYDLNYFRKHKHKENKYFAISVEDFIKSIDNDDDRRKYAYLFRNYDDSESENDDLFGNDNDGY